MLIQRDVTVIGMREEQCEVDGKDKNGRPYLVRKKGEEQDFRSKHTG